MNYPNIIWPQQIQGMDFHAMEILFRWLNDQITEIRNSLPRFEILAAQQEFEGAFVFDEFDKPANGPHSIWNCSTTEEEESFSETNPTILFPSESKGSYFIIIKFNHVIQIGSIHFTLHLVI